MMTNATNRPRRMRRWIWITVVVLCLLAAYGLALRWFSQRLETDMEKTFQLPPVASDQPRHPG